MRIQNNLCCFPIRGVFKNNKSNLEKENFQTNCIPNKENKAKISSALAIATFSKMSFKGLNEKIGQEKKEELTNLVYEEYASRPNYYDIPQKDIEWDVEKLLDSVKRETDYSFAKAALEKKENNKHLYKTADVIRLINDMKKNGEIPSATETISQCSEAIGYKELLNFDKLKQQNEEKYHAVLESPLLTKYFNNAFIQKTPQNLIFSSDISEFSQIEDACKQIPKKKFADTVFAQLTNLYLHDKAGYEYLLNSEALLYGFVMEKAFVESNPFGLNELKEIEKACKANTKHYEPLRQYISNSDSFDKADKLSEFISQFKTDNDITVYRGGRDSGIFTNVSIKGSSLAKMTREINEKKQEETKKVKIMTNSTKYHKNSTSRVVLYDYITCNENLTLADAMLMAQFGNDEFIEALLDEIKGTEITDERFKSTSFSEQFVDYWQQAANNKESTTRKEKLTIKKGTEGVYDSSGTFQAEFILNNKPKLFRYTNANYDRASNKFILEATVENI